MLTRRLSPLDDEGNWLTLWECEDMLNDWKTVRRPVSDAIRYHLDGYDYEWVAVVSPTDSAATPHEHIYLWVDDPDNEVDTSYLKPALEKHLDACQNAYEKHHRYNEDGSRGAITYRHCPERIDTPDHVSVDDGKQTTGAQYLASQLVHLALGDYYDNERDNPAMPLLDGGVLAWATHHKWFRGSI